MSCQLRPLFLEIAAASGNRLVAELFHTINRSPVEGIRLMDCGEFGAATGIGLGVDQVTPPSSE